MRRVVVWLSSDWPSQLRQTLIGCKCGILPKRGVVWVCNIILFRDYKHHQNLHEYSYNRVIHSPSLLSTMLISPRKSDSFRQTLSNSSRTGFEPIRWFLNVITWFQIFWPGIIQIHKKNEYPEKSQYFFHSFQKVRPIYYIDSLHRVKYFKPLFLEILMIMAYR